mmetsp:Transcript_19365/g.17173  ORF Transcript_19365/g.17173 Transcript_19365/m.17173 type:complete len:122 (-) Transcript_19365:102-467(-)
MQTNKTGDEQFPYTANIIPGGVPTTHTPKMIKRDHSVISKQYSEEKKNISPIPSSNQNPVAIPKDMIPRNKRRKTLKTPNTPEGKRKKKVLKNGTKFKKSKKGPSENMTISTSRVVSIPSK